MAVNQLNFVVGAETGLIKGIDAQNGHWENLNSVGSVSKENEINQLCWGNLERSKVCFGTRGGIIQEYDLGEQKIISSHDLQLEGPLRGLAKHENLYFTCNKDGTLRVWNEDGETQLETSVGPDVYKMRHNSESPNLVATGGKENELKVFDVTKGEEPVFTSKNVRHDWLELRVPVWVTDMAFYPDSEKIVAATGHHQIRVYDPKTQRRPVLELEFDENPITCLSLRPEQNQIVVGNTIGTMALIDLRKGGKVYKFRGVAGAIKDVQCHASEPVVISCGLDRYARVHDLNTKELLQKYYLKSRLNCLLLTDNSLEASGSSDAEDERVKDEDVEQSDEEEAESDEELWGNLGTIETKKLKRIPKHYHIEDSKRKKMDDEDSDLNESKGKTKRKKIGRKAKSKGT